MTKSLYQWAYLLFLVALKLCTIFGDVGVDVSTACDDHLDCGTTIGNPGTIGGDSDHNFKIKSKGGGAVDMQSFIDASSADTGSGATSWMAAKLSGISDTQVDALLPKTAHLAPHITARQAEECFVEMDNVLDYLRAASSTAGMSEKASTAPDTAGDTTSWWYCPSSKSLIQVHPAVAASLELSPLDDHRHSDIVVHGIFFEGALPSCPEAKNAENGGEGLNAVDACYAAISDQVRNILLENNGGKNTDDDNVNVDDDRGVIATDDISDTAGSDNAHDGDDVLHSIDGTSHPLAPTVDTPMSPLDKARHAPAPAMDPSLFEVNDKIPSLPPSHPLPPGMDPSLFASDEARHSPSPFVDAPLHTVDDLNGKSHPLRTAMDPSLIAFGEVPPFLSPSADPPLFLLDELRHAPAPEVDPSLFTDLDDESRPPAPPMDPSLFSLRQGHHASAAAMNPPLFSFEAARHALVPAMALSPSRYDEESCVNTAPQRKLRGAAKKDLTDGTILAQAQGEVAADEPFELEAFIVASRRKFVEAKLRREEDGYEGNFVARSILEVFKDVAVYVEDLLAEILPGWLHPTSGLIERAEECFHDADFVAVRPDWDPRNSHSDGLYERDDVDDDRYEGNGWLFCVPTNRLVQHDPTLVYPENAVTGHRAATSSPPSQTEHNYDEREDNYHDHSPVDAIVAADYALYVAEQMQLTQLARYAPLESYLPAAVAARLARHTAELADERSALETVFERFLARDKQEEEVRLRQVALYAPLESYLPAAVAARLARHIAELADERSALETVLERFFVRDKQEEERVAMETHEIETRTIETHIMTQMQNLLSGGGGGRKQLEEEEEALAPVCHAIECYAFVPTNVTTTECDALVDVLWAPPIDECTPPEALQGNDHHASSQSDCHLYLPPVSSCYAPVSIESTASSYDAKTSLSDTPGFHCNIPQLDRQPTAEDILFTFLGDVWATTNRRLQGLSASGALLVVGCVVALLGVLCTVGELTGPREDELRMTESELQRIIAVAVAEGVKDREEMLGKALLRKLDLLCMPGGALEAALEETSGKKEAADDAEEKDDNARDVESKQEQVSASSRGKERMAGGALQAAAEEPSGKQEAGDDAEEKDDKARDVESKQEEVSVSSRGKRRKTHRAGRKHRNGRKKLDDGLGDGGGGGGREEAKGEGWLRSKAGGEGTSM